MLSVLILPLVACDETPKTLKITGPTSIKATGASFTATTVGGFPIVGEVHFFWYIDANKNDFPEVSEQLRTRIVNSDTNGIAISKLWFKPKSSDIGKSVILSIDAVFYDPGTDQPTVLYGDYPVEVTR